MKKEFNNGPVYNKEYLKTKTKSCDDEVKDFKRIFEEIRKVNSNHTCLTIVSLDFVLKKDESYYPQGIFMII